MSSTAKERFTQLAVYLVLLTYFFLYFQEFNGRPYRQDETLMLGWAEEGDLLSMFDSIVIRPVQPGVFVIIDTWVSIFGSREEIGRALSHLMTLVTLSVVYRIGKEIAGRQVGFFSVLLLGTWTAFMDFSNQLYHYSSFWLGCSLLIFGTMLWLKSLSPAYVFVAVLGGGLAILSFLYAYYIILALGITALLLGQLRNRHFWLGFFTIVISLSLITCIWLFPNLYVIPIETSAAEYQAAYNTDEILNFTTWENVFRGLSLTPDFATAMLLIPGFLAFTKQFKSRGWDRKKNVFVLLTLLIFLSLVIVINLFIGNFDTRYIILTLILIAPIASIGLARLETSARITLLGIILLSVLNDNPPSGTAPYIQIVDYIKSYDIPQSVYISDATVVGDHWQTNYYIKNRLAQKIDNSRIYFVMPPTLSKSFYPSQNINFVTSESPLLYESIMHFVGEAEQVWRIAGTAAASEEWLVPFKKIYTLHRQRQWLPTYQDMYGLRVEEYRRIPDDLKPIAQANELTLMQWQLDLQSEAQPCQTIHLHSWWQASQTPLVNYSLSLALVGQDGQGVSQHGGGLSPTLSRLWKPGAPYLDERALFIPCDLPAGTYPLVFALYDSETLLNANFTTPNGDPIGRNLFLTQVTVSTP